MGIMSSARSIMLRLVGSERSNYPREVAVTACNDETIRFIKGTTCRYIAEIGVFRGHTSLEFAKFLNGNGELHLFDYSDRVERVATEIARAGYGNVRAFGSSYKLLDSYNWSLARMVQETRTPIYDYVFIDGAHTWAVDALTTFLVDRLLQVGGYLDFDDYEWTLADSPSLSPRVFPLTGKLYTEEQVATRQVKMIIDLIVRRSGRYREVVPNKVFQKLG